MEHHHHHMSSSSIDVSAGAGGGGDRFPQWSAQETRDFLMIRSELDAAFTETKRNKVLWEVTSAKMRDRGYNRSSDQCKGKWKNLVTRYKGCETMEAEGMRQQFPFYNEIQAIFAARMQRMLWMEAEGGPSGSKKRGAQGSSDEDDDNEDSEAERGGPAKKKKKKTARAGSNAGSNNSNLREILEEFAKQQVQIAMQWIRSYEARQEERRAKEMEWRKTMEALENERMMMERMWREREEQRRMREEARAEKMDALITQLLYKLRREDS